MFDLALLLVGNKLMAWQLPKGGVPQALRVQGETRLSVKATSTFIAACADVAAQLHDNGIELAHIQQVHYLADAAGRMLVHDSIGKTGFPAWSSWQLFASEWLGTRFGLGDTPLNGEVSWLQNELLPWLVTADTTNERQEVQEISPTEHQNGRLQAQQFDVKGVNECVLDANVFDDPVVNEAADQLFDEVQKDNQSEPEEVAAVQISTDPTNRQELLSRQGMDGVIFSDPGIDTLAEQMFSEVENQTIEEEEPPLGGRPEDMEYEELLTMMNPTPISKAEPLRIYEEAGRATLEEALRLLKIAADFCDNP